MGTIRGLITLALMGAFVALVVWLFVVRQRGDFDAAAHIPLEGPDKHNNGDNDE